LFPSYHRLLVKFSLSFLGGEPLNSWLRISHQETRNIALSHR